MTEKSISTKEEPAKRESKGEPDERSAGFVLFSIDNGKRKYLLLRHRNGGHWGFPKGHIELGETAIQAAQRETLEETGISHVEPISEFYEVTSYSYHRNRRPVLKQASYYLAQATYSTPTLSTEHIDSQWLTYNQAREKIVFDDTRAILDKAENLLSSK